MEKYVWTGLLALSTLGGCTYYEGGACGYSEDCDAADTAWDWDQDCWDEDEDECDDWDRGDGVDPDPADPDDMDTDTDPETETDVDQPDEDGLSIDPDTAEQGETLIAGITSDDGAALSAVSEVTLFCDCELLGFDVDETEVTLVLSIDEAAEGEVDILLQLEDGGVLFMDDAITIVPAEDCDDEPGTDPEGGDEDDCECP